MSNQKGMGGLIPKSKDDVVPSLLQSGVTYMPRSVVEKYDPKYFKKIISGEKIIPIKIEKDP